MSTLRYPNISGTTAQQLEQTKRYLYRLVEELNTVLGSGQGTAAPAPAQTRTAADTQAQALASFQAIKALIIKSADIVEAYSQAVTKRLEGVYVARSEFGDFAQHTALDIEANAQGVRQLYENVQAVVTQMDTLEHSVVAANAYINSGVLYYDAAGVPVYGLEIGQRNRLDGVEVFHKYARFTADKLSFYDSNGVEVAYVSDRRLYITGVEVTGELVRGGLVDLVQPDRTLVTKWIH